MISEIFQMDILSETVKKEDFLMFSSHSFAYTVDPYFSQLCLWEFAYLLNFICNLKISTCVFMAPQKAAKHCILLL